MINKFVVVLGCLLFWECAIAERTVQTTEIAQGVETKIEINPDDYYDLHSVPLFKEAYFNWRTAKSVGEQLDPLSVIWELALQKGVYLDVSQKLATEIPAPDESTTMHWAIPDIISILLVANQPEKAKPWIEALRKFDEKLLVPLYPLFASIPDFEVTDVDEGIWKNYQVVAFSNRGVEHIKNFQQLMAEREKYTHDQMIVLMVQKNLLR